VLKSGLPNDVLITLEAPALSAQDDRAQRAASAGEGCWPESKLDQEVGEKHHRTILISHAHDRDQWLATAAREGRMPMLATSDKEPLTLYGSNHKVHYRSGATMQFAAVSQYAARPATIQRAPELLAALGDALRAYWGMANAFETASRTGLQISPPGIDRTPPPGLPRLRVMDELAGPDVPQRLGWINYWSAQAAARLRFPDPARDANWLPRSREVGSGAWLLQLTEEPLDLDRKEHVELLAAAYARFDAVGRATE